MSPPEMKRPGLAGRGAGGKSTADASHHKGKFVPFLAAIEAAGITPPDVIVPNGRIKRFPTQDDGPGEKAGWYWISADGKRGVFGDHRQQITQKFDKPGPPLSQDEIKKREAVIEKDRQFREANQRKAAQHAQERWEKLPWATESNPYVKRKLIDPGGLGVESFTGALVVPIRDFATSDLTSLQYISKDGTKKFLGGGRVHGCGFALGDFNHAETIIECEGVATAKSLYEVMGLPVAAALSAGNLKPVGEILRKKYPRARLVFVADNDVETQRLKNPGVKAAREAARALGGIVVIPQAINGKSTDANDVYVKLGADALRQQIEAALTESALPEPMRISPEQWEAARTSPEAIVDNFLYPDVSILAAEGGVGKTTLNIWEAIHIILGLPLYGFPVRRSGPVVLATKEDSAETMIGRARECAKDMGLNASQIKKVQRGLFIIDYCGLNFRLSTITNDMVMIGPDLDSFIEHMRRVSPVLISFDPLASFWAGEQRLNDAAQGAIEAGRRIVRALGCAVRFVHHVGKENARNRNTDQYTPRGGSALSDGARMVVTLTTVDAATWRRNYGREAEYGLLLTIGKLTFAPVPASILLERQHFAFKQVTAQGPDTTAGLRADVEKILATMRAMQRPTQNTIKAHVEGVAKNRTRDLLLALQDEGVVRYVDDAKHGGAQKYLEIDEQAYLRWHQNLIPSRTPSQKGARNEPKKKY